MRLKQNTKSVEENKKNKYTKYFRILAVFLLIVIFMNGCGDVFGKINEGYTTEVVDAKETSDWIKSSVLAQPIGSLLLWVGGIVEWALGKISVVVSGGDAIMPWADAILFNAVPILDVNFINPDPKSIVAALGSIIQTMYYTILGLAIAFFSLVVMVMAIKLALSSIASEKAKYKSAMVSWATALVLLFTLHYFISFVFFLNESLVKVASNIVEEQLGDSSFTLTNSQKDENINDALEIIDSRYWADTDYKARAEKIEQETPGYFIAMTELPQDDLKDFFGAGGWLKGKWDELTNNERNSNAALIEKFIRFYPVASKLPQEYLDGLQSNEDTVKSKYVFYCLSGYGLYRYKYPSDRLTPDELKEAVKNDDETKNVFGENATLREKVFPATNGTSPYDNDLSNRLADVIVKVNRNMGKSNSSGYDEGEHDSSLNNNKMPITMMAEYFRKNAYMPKNDKSLVATDVYLPNCIMYLIFVIQSLLYFFSYMKRLFYVIVLALLGPVIIVFDFFNKM